MRIEGYVMDAWMKESIAGFIVLWSPHLYENTLYYFQKIQRGKGLKALRNCVIFNMCPLILKSSRGLPKQKVENLTYGKLVTNMVNPYTIMIVGSWSFYPPAVLIQLSPNILHIQEVQEPALLVVWLLILPFSLALAIFLPRLFTLHIFW